MIKELWHQARYLHTCDDPSSTTRSALRANTSDFAPTVSVLLHDGLAGSDGESASFVQIHVDQPGGYRGQRLTVGTMNPIFRNIYLRLRKWSSAPLFGSKRAPGQLPKFPAFWLTHLAIYVNRSTHLRFRCHSLPTRCNWRANHVITQSKEDQIFSSDFFSSTECHSVMPLASTGACWDGNKFRKLQVLALFLA